VLRGGLNAVLAWVSLMCCILSYTVHWEWDEKNHPHWDQPEYRHMMTTVGAQHLTQRCHCLTHLQLVAGCASGRFPQGAF
jgi:hypothetical protein